MTARFTASRSSFNRAFGPYLTDTSQLPDYAQVTCPVSEHSCQEAVWLSQPLLLGCDKRYAGYRRGRE